MASRPHALLVAPILLFVGILHAENWAVIYLQPAGATESGLGAINGSQQAGYATVGGAKHAAVWSGSADSFQDLNPEGASASGINGMSEGQQVGYATFTTAEHGTHNHAALWTGTAESFVDLQPAGATTFDSQLNATTGAEQIGTTVFNGIPHAGVWSGTAGSFVDLNPGELNHLSAESFGLGIGGNQQAGTVTYASNGDRAAVWSGSAGSYLDLTPTAIVTSSSGINATIGTQQVGYAQTLDGYHAALWSGTAESFVDLNPAIEDTFVQVQSYLTATSGARQVGYAAVDGEFHAGIWSGSSASFVDLHAYLSPDFSSSYAYGIWSEGDDTLVAGVAYKGNLAQAVLWKLLPDIPVPNIAAPYVTISGKKKVTTVSSKSVIKGTAGDTGGTLSRVEVKVGKAEYKAAQGTTAWKFTAHLKRGKNVVQARALDATGAISAPTQITITRR